MAVYRIIEKRSYDGVEMKNEEQELVEEEEEEKKIVLSEVPTVAADGDQLLIRFFKGEQKTDEKEDNEQVENEEAGMGGEIEAVEEGEGKQGGDGAKMENETGKLEEERELCLSEVTAEAASASGDQKVIMPLDEESVEEIKGGQDKYEKEIVSVEGRREDEKEQQEQEKDGNKEEIEMELKREEQQKCDAEENGEELAENQEEKDLEKETKDEDREEDEMDNYQEDLENRRTDILFENLQPAGECERSRRKMD